MTVGLIDEVAAISDLILLAALSTLIDDEEEDDEELEAVVGAACLRFRASL